MNSLWKLAWRAPGVVIASALLASCGGGGGSSPVEQPPQASGPLALKTLCNRADMVSDGDALVELVMPGGMAAVDVTFDLNGADVSGSFGVRSGGRVMGLVTGSGKEKTC